MTKIGFNRCDQPLKGGRRSIAVEGDVVERLTPYYYNGETIYGMLVDYSYCGGSGEFYFWLSGNFGAEEMYFLKVHHEGASLYLLGRRFGNSDVHIADFPWKDTKRYYTKATLKRFQDLGFTQKNFSSEKQMTPRNVLRVALPAILKAKREGRV